MDSSRVSQRRLSSIVITGMGGELGTRVANLLEGEPEVESIVGLDIDPPRRRLTRAEFHRVDPRNRARTWALIREVAPTALIHLGIYEPYARSSPRAAVARTASGTVTALGAAAAGGRLRQVVCRSGIEVYGRRRGRPDGPDEATPPDPTSPFGHSLLHVERVSRDTGEQTGAAVTLLRFAPLVGPHFPSPLGRLLRLPAVPFSPSDPPFSVLHHEDAAASVLAALRRAHDGPLNVVAPGTSTVTCAARIGRRLPVPVIGPGWRIAGAAAQLAGAPLPPHVQELLLHGRTADGARAGEILGSGPGLDTPSVVQRLYRWDEATYEGLLDAA
jgi:UDP-glucose 4-epimerase